MLAHLIEEFHKGDLEGAVVVAECGLVVAAAGQGVGPVVVGSDHVGREGDGWHQVTSELAFERSGPERFLSTLPVLAEMATPFG